MRWSSSMLACALGFASVSVLAASPDFPHVTTTGFGEVTATPDMATFSVKVVDTTMTAEQAKQSVDQSVETFLNKLNQAGLASESIKSSNLYLAPKYHYPKSGKAELVGYQASRSIEVTVNDLARLNNYLDLAIESGINQVDNIQLKVRNHAEHQEKARQEAIIDAREKAASLAEGFDMHLEEVWQINYRTRPSQPILMRSMSAKESSYDSSGYQDSTMTIRDQVDVIYKLGDEPMGEEYEP